MYYFKIIRIILEIGIVCGIHKSVITSRIKKNIYIIYVNVDLKLAGICIVILVNK